VQNWLQQAFVGFHATDSTLAFQEQKHLSYLQPVQHFPLQSGCISDAWFLLAVKTSNRS
jgi:uncharacterized membrane protein